MLLELWQRQAMADRQALIGRVEASELPTFATAQQRLDAALEAEPVSVEHIDPEQLELRQALGVA